MPCPSCGAQNPPGQHFCGACGQRLAGKAGAPASPVAVNPIYRHTFVGREAELRQLSEAFDATRAGQGALAMVVGEPGIGKTTLCDQLATSVVAQGGLPLIGHCYEPSSGPSLPYMPFVEALRGDVRSHDPEAVRAELSGGANRLAPLIPELRELVPVEPGPAGRDGDEERWLLFQAVSDLLHRAGDKQPLLLVLEDLHWANRGTLDLLLHIARSLAATRLLIVGTYRDVEIDRTDPLSITLAELRRVRELPRLLLRGLSRDEVERMLTNVAGSEARAALAETVQRQTEGNPLFVQELARDLTEAGRAHNVNGPLRIPPVVQDVIARRLTRLSPGPHRLLTIAAVIGREFRLDTLQQLANMAEDSLLAALEQARSIGVLEEEARVGRVGYRFAHALFRQCLYEELSAPRRARLHQEVAHVLEAQFGDQVDEHAAELVEHFAPSVDSGDLGKSLHYGRLAARQAIAVYAYREAARLLERALAAQEILDPGDLAQRCDLLLELGGAQVPLDEPRKVADTIASIAFTLAESLGDRARASRACHLALEALHGMTHE